MFIVYPPSLHISIHPPRVGRDGDFFVRLIRGGHFNPPSPCGEGPSAALFTSPPRPISIHPPRVGRDAGYTLGSAAQLTFQSTLPVWGGTQLNTNGNNGRIFQSTLPVWGGTAMIALLFSPVDVFQSTLPVWGGTTTDTVPHTRIFHFNPPSPCGEGRSV